MADDLIGGPRHRAFRGAARKIAGDARQVEHALHDVRVARRVLHFRPHFELAAGALRPPARLPVEHALLGVARQLDGDRLPIFELAVAVEDLERRRQQVRVGDLPPRFDFARRAFAGDEVELRADGVDGHAQLGFILPRRPHLPGAVDRPRGEPVLAVARRPKLEFAGRRMLAGEKLPRFALIAGDEEPHFDRCVEGAGSRHAEGDREKLLPRGDRWRRRRWRRGS